MNQAELPARLASARLSGDIQALLLPATVLRIWTGIFFIYLLRVFSLKCTDKIYPCNNCIFGLSIPKLREVSERYKGFGQGKVDKGKNIKNLKKW